MSEDREKKWIDYYARTAKLKPAKATKRALHYMPQGGTMLDLGAGSGSWAKSFLRDRDDITIDLIDEHIKHADIDPEVWPGEVIASTIQDYVPSKQYDVIWAYSVLFFLSPEEQKTVFTRYSNALKPGGAWLFSTVEPCDNATKAEFFGLHETEIRALLESNGLVCARLTREADSTYGKKKYVIPTFNVIAEKP